MTTPPENRRVTEAAVDPLFPGRWSPRAFSPQPVPREALLSLFEAARWAPSANNEQPWLFLYADEEPLLARFRPLFVDANRVWCDQAPALAFILARLHSSFDGKVNRWAQFDTGSAWMSLALQARLLGLYAHAMAGIHRDQVYDALNVPRSEYEVMAGLAIGYYGDPATLPPALREREKPNERKPLAEVARRGAF